MYLFLKKLIVFLYFPEKFLSLKKIIFAMLESQLKIIFARNKCVNFTNRSFHNFLCKNVFNKPVKKSFEKGLISCNLKIFCLFNFYNKIHTYQRIFHTTIQNEFKYGKYFKNSNISISKRGKKLFQKFFSLCDSDLY